MNRPSMWEALHGVVRRDLLLAMRRRSDVAMSVFFFRRVSNAYEKLQEQEAVLSTTLQENLTGVRVVKAFARQAYERDKFEGKNWQQYGAGHGYAGSA